MLGNPKAALKAITKVAEVNEMPTAKQMSEMCLELAKIGFCANWGYTPYSFKGMEHCSLSFNITQVRERKHWNQSLVIGEFDFERLGAFSTELQDLIIYIKERTDKKGIYYYGLEGDTEDVSSRLG